MVQDVSRRKNVSVRYIIILIPPPVTGTIPSGAAIAEQIPTSAAPVSWPQVIMGITEITGLVAGVFTAASLLPQFITTLKKKKAD